MRPPAGSGAPAQHTGQPLGKSPAPPANTAEQLQNRRRQIRAAGDVAEQELWRGSYSYKAMTGTLIAAGLITVVALVVLARFYAIRLVLGCVDLALHRAAVVGRWRSRCFAAGSAFATG